MVNNRIARLNHIATVILVVGAILALIGHLVRYKATSLEVRRTQ